MSRLGTGEGTLPALVLQPNTVNTNQLVDGAVTVAKILGSDWVVSKNSPGYMKLPNGIIVQWGLTNVVCDSNGNSQSITFPTAFTSVCWIVNVTRTSSSYAGNVFTLPCIYDPTTTGFQVNAQTNTGGGVANANFWIRWIAIGC